MRKLPDNRWERIVLHFHCMMRTRRVGWHLAGVWRELTEPRKRRSA